MHHLSIFFKIHNTIKIPSISILYVKQHSYTNAILKKKSQRIFYIIEAIRHNARGKRYNSIEAKDKLSRVTADFISQKEQIYTKTPLTMQGGRGR